MLSIPTELAIHPNHHGFFSSRGYHYNDVIMGTIASQITRLTIVYSTDYSDADQRKHQSSASLAFVRGIHWGSVNSPHKWPVTRKMFPFDDVIMYWNDPHFKLTIHTPYLSLACELWDVYCTCDKIDCYKKPHGITTKVAIHPIYHGFFSSRRSSCSWQKFQWPRKPGYLSCWRTIH